MLDEKIYDFIKGYFKVMESNLFEADYNGKKVTLDKPFRLSGEDKKFGVYVKNDKGNVILVKFGDANMEIRRDNPERRKSFLARHNCKDKKDKTTPGYWSCFLWSKNSVIP